MYEILEMKEEGTGQIREFMKKYPAGLLFVVGSRLMGRHIHDVFGVAYLNCDTPYKEREEMVSSFNKGKIETMVITASMLYGLKITPKASVFQVDVDGYESLKKLAMAIGKFKGHCFLKGISTKAFVLVEAEKAERTNRALKAFYKMLEEGEE